jgi:hypothetical protein
MVQMIFVFFIETSLNLQEQVTFKLRVTGYIQVAIKNAFWVGGLVVRAF